MKKELFTIIGATEYEMRTEESKNRGIANWIHQHYAEYTSDKAKIQEVKKKAKGQPTYEKNNKIYLVP